MFGIRDGNKPMTRGYPTRPATKPVRPTRLWYRVSGRIFKTEMGFNQVLNGSGKTRI